VSVALYPATTTSERSLLPTSIAKPATACGANSSTSRPESRWSPTARPRAMRSPRANTSCSTTTEAEGGPDRAANHTIDIERSCRARKVDELYFDSALLSLAPTDRVGEEAFRRHPRRHAQREQGRARPRRCFSGGAVDMLGARARGSWRQPALRQLGACGGGLLRRNPRGRAGPKRCWSSPSHYREDERQVPTRAVRGSLRECLDRGLIRSSSRA